MVARALDKQSGVRRDLSVSLIPVSSASGSGLMELFDHMELDPSVTSEKHQSNIHQTLFKVYSAHTHTRDENESCTHTHTQSAPSFAVAIPQKVVQLAVT